MGLKKKKRKKMTTGPNCSQSPVRGPISANQDLIRNLTAVSAAQERNL